MATVLATTIITFKYFTITGCWRQGKWVCLMGEQKHIEDDVLGEVHAFALDMHDIQSS